MKEIIRTIFLIVFCIVAKNSFAQEVTYNLKGRVVGRDSKEILLLRATEDARFDGISIPIKDNMFEYDLKTSCVEKYVLIFKEESDRGSWRPIEFFPDSAKIEFTLYPFNEFDKNIITGGRINKEKNAFEKQQRDLLYSKLKPFQLIQDSLLKNNKYFSKKTQNLNAKIAQAQDFEERNKLYKEQQLLQKSNEAFTPAALTNNNKMESIFKAIMDSQNNYAKKHLDIYSYSLLLSSLQMYSSRPLLINIESIKSIYPSFSKKFPVHPYTKKIDEMLNAINKVQVGGHYIDFTAPTLDGKTVRLSEEIKGKVALIDLWASWCGPCRATSISVIPLYQKYKNKGFIVIGVAAEFKNTDAFKIALEKDKYPWLNLIELDNKNDIWNKYNIAGSGGSTFLVDSNGKILAIHPDAEELENHLKKLLK